MSKSRGTGIDANDAMSRFGADVLRLWAASVEPIDDVRFGPNVIEQVGRVYRNIRNRMRFMLSNLDDLSASGVVAREAMEPIDRLACTVADAFVAGVKDAYDRCQIHDAYLRIVEFESSMSSLYFDALKDPLYSRAASDPRRRSAQSALLYVLTRFLTAVAPVLSFTAEEAWQHLPQWARATAKASSIARLTPAGFAREQKRISRSGSMLRELRARVAASAVAAGFRSALRLDAADARIQASARAGRQLARSAGRFAARAASGRCARVRALARRG